MAKFSRIGRKRSRSSKRGRKIPLKHATRPRKRVKRMSAVARRRVSRVAKAAAASLIKSFAERKTLVVNHPFRQPTDTADIPHLNKLRWWNIAYGTAQDTFDTYNVSTHKRDAHYDMQRSLSIDNKNVYCFRPHDWILAKNPDTHIGGTAIDVTERFGVSYRQGIHVNLNSITIRGTFRGIDHELATGKSKVRIVMFETKSGLPLVGSFNQKAFQGKSWDPGADKSASDEKDLTPSRMEEAVFLDNKKGRSWYHDKWNMSVVKKVYFDRKYAIGKHGLIYDLETSSSSTTNPTEFGGFTILSGSVNGHSVTKNKEPNTRSLNIYYNFGPMGKRLTYQSENSTYHPDQTNQNIYIAMCLDTGVPIHKNLPYAAGTQSGYPWPYKASHPDRFVDHSKLQMQLAYTDLG